MNLSSVMYKAWNKVDKKGLQDRTNEALRNQDYKTIRQIRESTSIVPFEAQNRIDSSMNGYSISDQVRSLMEATSLRPSMNAVEKAVKIHLRKGDLLFLDNLTSLGISYTIPQADLEDGFTTLIYHRDFEKLQQSGSWLEHLPSRVLEQGIAAYAKGGWSDDIETITRTLGKVVDPQLVCQARQRAAELQLKTQEHRVLFGSLQIDSWFCLQFQDFYKDSNGIDKCVVSGYERDIYNRLKLGKSLDSYESYDFFGIPATPDMQTNDGRVFLYLTQDQQGFKLQAALDKTYRSTRQSNRLTWTQFAAAGPRDDLQKVLDIFEKYPKSIRTFLQTVCHWEQKPTEANLVERMEHLYLYDEEKGKRHYHFCPDGPL